MGYNFVTDITGLSSFI